MRGQRIEARGHMPPFHETNLLPYMLTYRQCGCLSTNDEANKYFEQGWVPRSGVVVNKKNG